MDSTIFWTILAGAELDAPSLVIAWLIGGALAAVAFWLNRNASPAKRIAMCSCVLALAFTPSIVIHHTSVIVPAIVVLGVSPFEPMYGWRYSLMFGVLLIFIAWMVIASVWSGLRK